MMKEFFAVHRRLIITIFAIVAAIGIIIFFVCLTNGWFNGLIHLNIVGTVDENNDITLTDLPKGTYTLYYENNAGILEDYSGITVTDLSYSGLVKENTAPMEATRIGVYDEAGERVGQIDLGTLTPPDLGAKLYSNATISDIHLQYDTAVSDFQKAMDFFNSLEDLLFVNICGDLTEVGSAEELADYKEMRDKYSEKPVYAVSGNHEYLSCTSFDSSNWTTYTGHNLWYSYTQGNDVYIMVGMHGSSQPFSASELQWLYETLEANRNKRCFVYQHVFPWGGSGDVAGLNGHGDVLDNVPGKVFLSLMSHYKNVIWFHGHSHQKFHTQEQYQSNNIDSTFARYSVHIPSLALPRIVIDNTETGLFEESEGYVVDVYENGIILRGRDFIEDKFLPIATFYLDTTLQSVAEGTYYDPTGTILNQNTTTNASLPEGTTFLINKRYSESDGGIIDARGYASFIIPCTEVPYDLQIKGTNLDMTKNQSCLFLLDSDKSLTGKVNGSKFFSEMSGVTVHEDGTIQTDIMPTAKTAYIMVCIAEGDEQISIHDIDDYVISLNKSDSSLDIPEGTSFLINKRYSESGGGIVDSNGYATFIIPCDGSDAPNYILQIKNSNLDITENESCLFLLDADQKYAEKTNGSKFFCEMSGVTAPDSDTIQVDLTPPEKAAYILISIAESDSKITIDDISDYIITLTKAE